MDGIPERGLKPHAAYGGNHAHGTRMRYLAGCKCRHCRAANSNYETARARARKAGDWNGIVDAAAARRHMLRLSCAGVGRHAIAEASDVALTVICEIRSGRKRRIRARTARAILAVTTAQRKDHALVSAAKPWRQIERLLEHGFTKARIAHELGRQTAALQIGKRRVTVRNAAAIDRLWRRYMTVRGH